MWSCLCSSTQEEAGWAIKTWFQWKFQGHSLGAHNKHNYRMNFKNWFKVEKNMTSCEELPTKCQTGKKKKRLFFTFRGWLEWKRNCEGKFKKMHLLWNLLPNSMKLMFSFTYKSQQLKILKFVLTGDPLYMDWHEKQREKTIHIYK